MESEKVCDKSCFEAINVERKGRSIKDEDEVNPSQSEGLASGKPEGNNSEKIEHIDYSFHQGDDERTYLFRSLLVDFVEYERCKDDNDNNEKMYQMMFHLIERAYKSVNSMSDEKIHEFLNI